MSEADKVFNDLGFYKQENPNDDEILLFYVRNGEYVLFYKDKTISTSCAYRDYVVTIDMEILNAINLKCKELGWL